MTKIDSLEPSNIWKYFNEILQIPRPSGQEDQIRNFLIEFAKENHLTYKTDQTGNLVIYKKASQGYENRKGVVLQSHMDMVCEKNSDVTFDFSTEAIPAYVEGNWVRSRGTTLGADDGIGIAAQLAILTDPTLEHGPLECLFTVEEETGLTGAFGLQPGFLEGKTLLNLDSEDEGEIFIGCAGGVDVTAWFDFVREVSPDNHQSFTLSITGLKGGHSGDDIHKGLGNSIKAMTRFLWENQDKLDIKLSSLSGGNLRNAIPREAECTFCVPNDKVADLRESVISSEAAFKTEHPRTEPSVKYQLRKSAPVVDIIDKNTQSNLLNALYACPHGVVAWSQTMENMVETSSNLAAISIENERITITTSQRSSLNTAKTNIANMVTAVFLQAGAEVKKNSGYPGWNPNPESELVRLSARVYEELFGQKPVVRAIHAGLECGLFLEKYPDLDMISFGPTIKGAHSPDERLNIETTKKFYTFLEELIKRI